jgi:hypothetical protein
MYFFVLLLLLVQLANPSAPPDMPPDSGVYFRQEGKWINLRTATVSSVDTKGLGQYIQTDGFTGLEMDFVCQGAQALTRITSQKPVFYVRGVGLPDDALIVQFEQKKNSRNLRASLSDSSAANKAGFRKNTVRNVAVVVFPDKSFSITPQEDLRPGEYLLTFGKTTNSYDFGIDRR